MRRESSTVVALVGDVTSDLLGSLARSPNVSVAQPSAGPGGLDTAAAAMREAARQRGMYVVVPADPLADVAASWQNMWDLAAGSSGATEFERCAAEALAAWRAKSFELPDYYLVMAPAHGSLTAPDLYLGPLRAARPRRVAVAAVADSAVHDAGLLDALRS